MRTGSLWQAILILLVVAASGCSKEPINEKEKLSIVVREGLEAEGIRRIAEVWGRKTNVDVKVDALGRSTYETVTRKALAAASPNYDVVFFPGTQVAEMAQSGALSPIENWRPEDDPDLLSYSKFKGAVYALPCDISTFFMFLRADVVSQPPETWREMLDSGPKWSSAATPGVATRYGYALAGQAGEELPKIFYPILWSHGGYVIDGDRVGLDTKEAIEAATLFKQLATSSSAPREIQSWNALKILDELKAGTVALTAPQWNALYPLIKDSGDPVAKQVTIAPIPGVRQRNGTVKRVNFIHTWVLVKPARGKRGRIANDFILYATGKEGARLYAETARGNPARRSILSDVKLHKDRPEFPLMLDSIRMAQSEPDVPYYSELHEVMNIALTEILSNRRTPEEAMRAAARSVQDLRKRAAAGR